MSVRKFRATSHSAALITSGTLNTANGGTGMVTIGSANQIMGANAAGSALEYKTLAGTANQINVANSAGTISLSIPTIGTAGTYSKVITDAYGRVTGSTTLVASDLPPMSATTITTGTLAVANGGTGVSTFTNNGVLIGSGSSALSATASGAQYNILTVNGSNAPAFGQLNLSSTAAVSGTLPTANGGTGLTTIGSANQTMGVNATGTALEYKTVAGTTNQIAVTNSAGTITLSTPQSINTTSNPTFAGMALNGNLGIGNTAPSSMLDVSGAITERGIAAPTLSSTGQGRIYFDSTTNDFRISQNGGAYTPLATGGTVTTVTAGNGLTGGPITTTGSLSLAAVGTAGTYSKVITDTYGRVTGSASLIPADLPAHSAALITSGTLNTANGGTGMVTIGSANQIMGANAAGSALEYKTVAGTANQINVANSAGTISLSIPTIGTPGTYSKVITDVYGRVTGSTTLVSSDLPPTSASTITTGTFAVANGGTGVSTFTNNGVLIGSGSSALSATASGAQYNILTVNGSNAPAFGQLNLSSTAAVSGTLATANGGTGLPTIGSANQIMGANAAGSALEYKTVAGTTNQITVANSAGAITLSTPQSINTTSVPTFAAMILNGNLGIGTTSPASLLQLGTQTGNQTATPNVLSLGGTYSSTPGTNMKLRLFDDSNASNQFGFGVSNAQLESMVPAGAKFAWFVGGAEKVKIDTNGNVGIGTTAPGYNLQIGSGSSNAKMMMSGSWSDPNYATHSRLYFNDGNFGIGAGNISGTLGDDDLYFFAYGGADRDIRFMHTTNGSTNPSTWATDLIIKQGGNVGIGTTTPAGALDVSGDILNNGQAVSGNFKYVTSLSDWRNNSSTCTVNTWCDIPDRTITYVKKRSASILRVSYQETLGTNGTNYGQCQWRFLIDSTSIVYFSDADITYSGGWRMQNATHTGLGVGVAVGSRVIKVQNMNSGATECLQGWNTSGSYLSVEEVGP